MEEQEEQEEQDYLTSRSALGFGPQATPKDINSGNKASGLNLDTNSDPDISTGMGGQNSPQITQLGYGVLFGIIAENLKKDKLYKDQSSKSCSK